jgi:hypothetical protein
LFSLRSVENWSVIPSPNAGRIISSALDGTKLDLYHGRQGKNNKRAELKRVIHGSGCFLSINAVSLSGS